MFTEYLSSVSTNSDAHEPFNGLFEGEETSASKEKTRVESIDPAEIHVYGEATWADVAFAREMIQNAEADDQQRQEYAEIAAEAMVPEDDNSDAYIRHRAEIQKILLSSDKQFDKKAKFYERNQARRDGVKLARRKPAKDEEGSAQVMPASVERFTNKKAERRGRTTEKSLRRDIRAIDRNFGGLVGDIAATGTKASYLESKYDEFAARMDAFGAEVNAKNRRSVERETVRKLMDAETLADRKGLEGEERRAYIDGLVDTFHSYVTLDDDARARFDKTLEIRQRADKELRTMERQRAIDTTPELEKGESRRTRLMRGIGAVAAGLRARGKDRWEARKARQEDDEPTLFDDKPYRKKRGLSSRLDALNVKSTIAYRGALQRVSDRAEARRVSRQEKLAAMSDEERMEYEEKTRRRNTAVAVGAAAVAVVGTGLALMYGLDHLADRGKNRAGDGGVGDIFGRNTDSFPDADRDGIPDSIDADSFKGNGNTDGGDRATTRAELFDGSRSSRRMSAENANKLRDFLAEYKVKENDDQGVWGIATKYLNAQGIANPTVFEVDAVKDYVLEHSSLSSKSVLHPGDTIKLK